jgi:hypothetical protein
MLPNSFYEDSFYSDTKTGKGQNKTIEQHPWWI